MKIVVVFDVQPRSDGFTFFAGTLRKILESLVSTKWAKRFDYRFTVVSVSRIDQEA